jgi:hypothetical protein
MGECARREQHPAPHAAFRAHHYANLIVQVQQRVIRHSARYALRKPCSVAVRSSSSSVSALNILVTSFVVVSNSGRCEGTCCPLGKQDGS